MGNCVSTGEDKGIGQKASDMRAVGADIDAIDDAALSSMQFDADAGLKQKLILNISCQNLANLDTKSKSDTFCVLYKMSDNMRNKIG